ncbi:MAG: hypothetical protein GY801_40865 [bacterium]|nr:hypothetical protein [bacterium]
MRTFVTILCALVVLSATGLADEVAVKGLTYSNVKIFDAKKGKVFFRISVTRTQSKSFADITRMSIVGMDNFNKAEKLMSEQSGASKAKTLRTKRESVKEKIAEITRQVADPSKEIARLKKEAKRLHAQVEADKKAKNQLTKKIAERKKREKEAKAKDVKLENEAAKLLRDARAIEAAKRNGWQNLVAQRRNQARVLLDQVSDQDPAKVRAQASSKRSAAKKYMAIAERTGDAAKKAAAEKLYREADILDDKAKRLTEEKKKKSAERSRLASDKSRLTREINAASSKARTLGKRAQKFPETARKLEKKRVELEIELGDIDKKLRDLIPGDPTTAQYSAAIQAYEAASAKEAGGYIKSIIDFRLLSALNEARSIDKATVKWLQLADREKAAEAILACYPKKLPKKGDARNARAITLLDSRVRGLKKLPKKGDARNARAITLLDSRVRGLKDKNYTVVALKLLVHLLRHEGRESEIGPLLGDPRFERIKDPELELLKAQGLLAKKDYAKAESVVNGVLHDLKWESLPEALMIRGKAVLARSGTVTDKEKKQAIMLDAGVDFMRVYTQFSNSPLAGEALYLTGMIMTNLPEGPNMGAARKAWETVARDYAGTSIGQKAKGALEKIK